MSTALTRAILIVAVLLVLAVVNGSIYGKERIKAHGEVILLELAPVDPRSLMQGDYMALRFSLADHLDPSRAGTAPLALDDRRVATLSHGSATTRLQIRYRVRNGRVWLGTNAYFFEEGSAARFTGARYGEFRVDPASGEAVLVALRDEHFAPL
jgi:uncharacterized membrane-anchored protein